jgi:hypothetical protein
MNNRNRTKTLETLVNKVEGDTIADHLRDIGMAFSTWSRLVMFGAIAEHDALLARPVESRKCRDAPPASRASDKRASNHQAAHHRHVVRSGFGGALRPIRV